MNENNIINENEVETPVNDNINYIQALNDLKNNSVSKERYEKLVAENKQLVDTLISNGQMQTSEATTPVDIEALRAELFARRPKNMTNLEYVEKAMELRDAVLERDQIDIFLPNASTYTPTIDDIATANRVANTFRHCIDYANGNSEVFTNELMRLTKDSNPRAGMRR